VRLARIAAWVLAALACVAPVAVQGQVLKCASHTIAANDAHALLAAATRVAGPLMVDKVIRGACMNPGHGNAWLNAKSEPQQDGSWLVHDVSCDRDVSRWHCELSSIRHGSTDVERDGKHLQVDFTLPADLDLTQARQIVARAFAISPGVRDAQECFSRRSSAGPAAEPQISKDVQAAFDVSGGTVTAEIGRDPVGGYSWITVNGIILEFTSPTPTGEWGFDCWSIEVVVT